MSIRSIINIMLTATFVVWAGFLVGNSAFLGWHRLTESKTAAERRVDQWRSMLNDHQVSMGTKGSQVVIIEFVDYQCPFCRLAEPNLENLIRRHPGHVVLYRYEFPQDGIHPYARTAARAAECAATQGVTEAYQAALLNKQPDFSDVGWVGIARNTGVSNLRQFQRCMTSQVSDLLIERDTKMAYLLGIRGTPTFIVNGVLYEGVLSPDKWTKLFTSASSGGS